MSDENPSPLLTVRRVGPPVLLGLRPRFMDRAIAAARQDERVRALSIWGSLAGGDADEWTGVDFIATVEDGVVPDFLDELCREESLYGRSLVTLRMPQNGVEGGGFVAVTYLQSGLALPVDWYVCPESLGLAVRDTKLLFAREKLPESGSSFAELLRERPSQEASSPPAWDVLASMIPIEIAEVARGRPEAVSVEGQPMHDRSDAYDVLARRIAELPDTYGSDVRAALFYHLGVARRGR